ncbi:transcription initiation factor TFIID subunit 4-like [Camarhynchus parvulus]|uniref:transcription initiation factor TFIID subunit 4-like n=1 Tax=Geospiza parvula TaxID=87175 RepID=UPI001237C1D4|nr:transcription initiation factor TFIID subunit 4-like [Camarhynchus parvulus]
MTEAALLFCLKENGEQVPAAQRRPLPAGRARRLRRGAGASAAAARGLGRCHPAPGGTSAGGGDNPTLRPRRLLVTKRLSPPSLPPCFPASLSSPPAGRRHRSLQLPANPALDSRPPRRRPLPRGHRRAAGEARPGQSRACGCGGAAGGGRGEMRLCARMCVVGSGVRTPGGRQERGGQPFLHRAQPEFPGHTSLARCAHPHPDPAAPERSGDSPIPAPVRRPRTQLGLYLRQRPAAPAPARQRPQRWPREGPGAAAAAPLLFPIPFPIPFPSPPAGTAQCRARPGRAPATPPCLIALGVAQFPPASGSVAGAVAAAGSALSSSGLRTLPGPPVSCGQRRPGGLPAPAGAVPVSAPAGLEVPGRALCCLRRSWRGGRSFGASVLPFLRSIPSLSSLLPPPSLAAAVRVGACPSCRAPPVPPVP